MISAISAYNIPMRLLIIFAFLSLFCFAPAAIARAEEDTGVPFVTEADFFEQVKQADKPVLVQFEASWCPYCRKMQPHLKDMSVDKQASLKIVRVDVDLNNALAAEMAVRSLPTLILYADGEVIGRLDGSPNKDDLYEWVDAHIKK